MRIALIATLAALTSLTLRADEPEARRKPALELADGDAKFLGEVLISPDGKFVASPGEDNQVRIWSLATGKLLHRLNERPRQIGPRSVTFSRDGKALIVFSHTMKADLSGTETRQLSWWDAGSGKRL